MQPNKSLSHSLNKKPTQTQENSKSNQSDISYFEQSSVELNGSSISSSSKRDKEKFTYGKVPSGFKEKVIPDEFCYLSAGINKVNCDNYLEILQGIYDSLMAISKIENANILNSWITENLNPSIFSLNDKDRKSANELFAAIQAKIKLHSSTNKVSDTLFMANGSTTAMKAKSIGPKNGLIIFDNYTAGKDEDSAGDGWVAIDNPSSEDGSSQNNVKQISIKELTYGRLDAVYVSGLICNKLTEFFKGLPDGLHNSFTHTQNDRTVEIQGWVRGKEGISQAIRSYQYEANKLTLIPYGVTNRGFLREDHMVLVAIYKGKLFVIDPKRKSSSQIDVKQLENLGLSLVTLSPGWQTTFDTENCGRYTAYIGIYIAKLFINYYGEFNLERSVTVMQPRFSDVKELQLDYCMYLKKFFIQEDV